MYTETQCSIRSLTQSPPVTAWSLHGQDVHSHSQPVLYSQPHSQGQRDTHEHSSVHIASTRTWNGMQSHNQGHTLHHPSLLGLTISPSSVSRSLFSTQSFS